MANNKEPVAWITVHGVHVPLFEGDSKEDAIRRAITGKNPHTKPKSLADTPQSKLTTEQKQKLAEKQLKKNPNDTLAKHQIEANKKEADRLNSENSTQSVHKRAIAELNDSRYEDGTYDITTKKSVSFSNGYQVTFCQIGDNYTDADYQQKVNECLKMSSDGKTYAGKFGGSPEISFHCNSKEEAIAYAKANNQISIWDWAADNGNGAEIDCGGSGDRNKTRAQVEKEWEEAAKKNK